MNRARKFVTMKMKKRAELRTTKRGKKDRLKARQLLSEQVMRQLRAKFQQEGLINEDGEIDVEKIGAEGSSRKMILNLSNNNPTNEDKDDTSSSSPIIPREADTGNQASSSPVSSVLLSS
jgi:hypothetical protein